LRWIKVLRVECNRANEFEFQRNLNKIGKPIDRTEWGMTPPTVDAYYNPSFNEIVFPAGILQPPFFDARADDATNYGAMGAVIGHRLTHGFDDEGISSMRRAT
jgi:predicted metalloendopeptidase